MLGWFLHTTRFWKVDKKSWSMEIVRDGNLSTNANQHISSPLEKRISIIAANDSECFAVQCRIPPRDSYHNRSQAVGGNSARVLLEFELLQTIRGRTCVRSAASRTCILCPHAPKINVILKSSLGEAIFSISEIDLLSFSMRLT